MAKTKKGRVVHDSFEQVAELGKDTAIGLKDAIGAFSPLNIFENLSRPEDNIENQVDKNKDKNQGHTPIDVGTLKQKYEAEDKQKENALRQRLFHMVKEGEDTEVQKKKREEQEKIRLEEQEKQKKEEEKKRQEEANLLGNMPQGKQRKSIFSPKMKAQQQHAETKPSVGKS